MKFSFLSRFQSQTDDSFVYNSTFCLTKRQTGKQNCLFNFFVDILHSRRMHAGFSARVRKHFCYVVSIRA